MLKSDSYAESGRMPSADPFNTRDTLLTWMEAIAPYGLFTTDAALVIRSWNRWLVIHSGLSAEQVVGRRLVEVFPDLAARKLDAPFTRALHGEVCVLSTRLHKYLLPMPPTSRAFDVRRMLQTARITPLPAGDEIVGTITIIEDVTQRECQALSLRRQQAHDRLLSASLARLLQSEQPLDIAEGLFAQLAAPLKLEVFLHYLLAPDGGELRLQAAAGVAPDARQTLAVCKLGEDCCGQIALERTPLIESHVQMSLGERTRTIRRLGLRSFAGFPLLIGERLIGTLAFGSYQRDDIAPDEIEFLAKIAQHVAIALDRAQREQALREAQLRLRHHADELEVTIAQRTEKLRDTVVQLESFSHTIAHDLRAPIRSLMGFTEILLTDFADTLPAPAEDLVQRIHRASVRLDALTRDLLKFSRIVGQDVELAAVDLDELVQDIVAATPTLHGGVLVVKHPLGGVRAQRTLLQQCLANLFDNAVKFAVAGAPPSIVVSCESRPAAAGEPSGSSAPFQESRVSGAAPAGRRVRIWIEDRGIGIAPAAHHKIFGIFERLPGPTPVEGTGIGLAIVARAMQQMGGTCGVESEVGRGSRFWLELAPAP